MSRQKPDEVCVETRPQRAYAKQWLYSDILPLEVCPEGCTKGNRTRKPERQSSIGGPHVHLPNGSWVFITPGDWIVRAADGSFVEVMDNETFQSAYRLPVREVIR